MNFIGINDSYTIINLAANGMFGEDTSLQAHDTSSFVAVGEKMLRTGYESTLNALSFVYGDIIADGQKYVGKLRIFNEDNDRFGAIIRKIRFYAKKFEASENFNTIQNPNTLDDGSSVDHYKISKKYPLELNFVALQTLQYKYTRWEDQLEIAFHSPEEFARFSSEMMIEIANDIETGYEAKRRLLLQNAIGATYNTGTARQKVNLRVAFNNENGTTYSVNDLLTTYKAEFYAFMIERIKGDMQLMEERNTLFHIYPARNDDSGNALIYPTFTRPEDRRMILYMPLIRKAEANVLPALFGPDYLRLENYEGVEYWSDPVNKPSAVSVTPNQLDAATGASITGNAVALDYVVGLLFDKKALATSIKFEKARTTPINADGGYYNTVVSWLYQNMYDACENMILYYLAD